MADDPNHLRKRKGIALTMRQIKSLNAKGYIVRRHCEGCSALVRPSARRCSECQANDAMQAQLVPLFEDFAEFGPYAKLAEGRIEWGFRFDDKHFAVSAPLAEDGTIFGLDLLVYGRGLFTSTAQELR